MRMLRFLDDDLGQDLVEYTLLVAFVALASAALFAGSGNGISGLWNSADSKLTSANTTAAASGSGSGSQPADNGRHRGGGGDGHGGGGPWGHGGGGDRHHF